MLRRFRLFFVAFGVSAVLLTIIPAALYLAAHYEPAFYAETLRIEPQKLEKGSDDMLLRMAGLISSIRKQGRWGARFTADEINGWLSVDLVKNHPKALPANISDPRVAIRGKSLTLACRYARKNSTNVVSLTLEPFVAKPNVLALRLINIRAGMLPVPLQPVLDGLSQAARDSQLHLEWRTEGSDPVALISLPQDDSGATEVRLESVQVEDGTIAITGSTRKRNP